MDVFIQITKESDKYLGMEADYVKPRMVEHASKILGPLSYDDYRDVLDITTQPNDFWRRIFIEARDLYTSQKLEVPPPVPETDINLTHEQKQELEHKKLKEFFFKKDQSNRQCDCGAAHTSFPNIHQPYCTLYKQSLSKTVNLDYTD
jgi:hypothetical protein